MWRDAAGLGFTVPRTGPLEVMAEPLKCCAREGGGQSTVTRRYRRYLRLVSSSRVRSTTSGGEDQFCWGATAVHGCAGWALPNGEPRFQEATLWITPPLGCTHLQEDRDTHTHSQGHCSAQPPHPHLRVLSLSG